MIDAAAVTKRARLIGALLAACLALACEGAPAGLDAALHDASAHDAGNRDAAIDAGARDAAADAERLDASAGVIGILTGACGELDDTELLGADAFYFESRIDFPSGFTDADIPRLSAGAREILAEGTAGGSSEHSEAFSFEILHRCEGALLVKSETEIVYDPIESAKTDILVEIDGHLIGVSVTRAVGFPREDPYTVEQARALLERKLMDILESSANVVPEDRWVKQILHVIAYAPMHAESMRAAWDAVDPSLRADTILFVTISDGDDAFLY
jgi:hypothetical protein